MDENIAILLFVMGVMVGIPIGFMIAKQISVRPQTVIFTRDSEGRIVEIHYLPGILK